MNYLTTAINTAYNSVKSFLPEDPQLLTQEIADQLEGERISVQYQKESYGLDSDHDLVELDARVMVFTPRGKYAHRVMGKPITREGVPIDEDHLDLWVKRVAYDCFEQTVPGLLWGSEKILHHKYTIFTQQGDAIVIGTPLYSY